jgi:nucleotide-binding universal stress UspA family protein
LVKAETHRESRSILDISKGKIFREIGLYKKILAPLDGSELAERALEHVRAVTKGSRAAKVILLQVVSWPAHPAHTLSDELIRSESEKAEACAKDYLAKVADSLKRDGIAVETAIVRGGPAEEILDYAKKNEVDLIIMSTHGRSGVSRWVFGSVADRVVHHSATPVLIVTPPGFRSGE